MSDGPTFDPICYGATEASGLAKIVELVRCAKLGTPADVYAALAILELLALHYEASASSRRYDAGHESRPACFVPVFVRNPGLSD